MSVLACLPGLVEQGKISEDQAARAAGLFGELHQDMRRQFGDQAANKMASDAALEALTRELRRKKYLAGLSIQKRQQMAVNLKTFNGGDPAGPMQPDALPAMLDRDPRARFSNVEMRRKAVLGDAHRRMDEVLARFSTNLVGQLRGKAQLGNLVRELFGHDSGDPAAREMAQAWRETAEELRQRFNAAGGNIGKLEMWGLPQSHDYQAVKDAGPAAWKDFVRDRLDRSKMIDRETGLPMSDARLELVLDGVWKSISTNGLNTMTPGAGGQGMLANRRGDRRVLIFDGADNWLAYNDTFGRGTAYDAMMAHMEGMARDIAAMEVLGPNPAQTLRWAQDMLRIEAGNDMTPGSDAVARAKAAIGLSQDLWNQYTGALNEPRNEKLGLVFTSFRNVETAAKLGSAFLSAPADFAFTSARASFNGLSQTRMMGNYLKLFATRSLEDQKMAVRRGLIAEEWGRRTQAQENYPGMELSGEIPRRMADGVMRASLLARHTQSLRWVNGMEWLASFTEAAGQSFDQLDPKLRGALDRNGIGPDGWEKLRTAPMETDRGAEWLTPRNTGDRELASRFMEAIHGEVNLAVPTPGLRTQAMINSNVKRGTVFGEVIRSAALFKSFGITVLVDQAREIMAMAGTQRAKYVAHLLIGTTLMGGVSIMLKDVASGRDPRDAADVPFYDSETGEFEWNPGFWGAALFQGGGFGIFGDFLRSAENRYSGGIAGALAGPIFSDLQGLYNVADAAASGGNWESAAIKSVKGMMPGGSLWYARLAFDRLLADQVQQLIDPNYSASWRRMDRWAAEQGTGYYWEPGELTPERAPDVANAIAGSEGP